MSRAAAPDPSADPTTPAGETLLRIQEAAELVGLTARSIRYYEEMGLLSPSSRSQGAYRLFDRLDVERLQFIKGLRDDAGFSIAEVRRLLEDEAARRLAREALAAADDPLERRRILDGRLASIDELLAGLRAKAARLGSMVAELEGRRLHVLGHLAELGDAGIGIGGAPAAATVGTSAEITKPAAAGGTAAARLVANAATVTPAAGPEPR